MFSFFFVFVYKLEMEMVKNFLEPKVKADHQS